ncbi:alpha-2-macroglobulin-like [Polymixia lowei]
MALPGFKTRRWLLFACLSWICTSQVVAGPQYMVAIPAVLEADSETKFCASLLQPNETLALTVTMISPEKNTTLLQETSNAEFHRCVQFKAPAVQEQVVQKFAVEVRGETFLLTDIRKVMIKPYRPATFIQTDKPIYLPGQTVQFRVISLDSRFRSVSELYETIELMDSNRNRIGQWLNTTSNGKILQLSHTLNSEAPEGTYRIQVWIHQNRNRNFIHTFKVEKYVLPKFDVKVEASEEISIRQEEFEIQVCSTYTYGPPVPGTAEVNVVRPISHHIGVPIISTPEHPEGIPEITAPFHKEKKQMDKTGCATFTLTMSKFTRAQKMLRDHFIVMATVEEEGTDIIKIESKTISLSYVVGKLSFIDTPKVYEEGSVVEGKVKAVYFNNTPIPDKSVYLFEGERWSARHKQNLTTDSDGVASFSLNTTNLRGSIDLIASIKPTLDYHSYRTPHYETGDHTLSLVQPVTADTKTVSSLEVKNREEPLLCETEELITIQYTVAGEAKGSVDIMYLILSRGTIVKQGLLKVEVQDGPVTKDEVSFELQVSPEMAPLVQVVAYAVLPSENVIAHSADFDTQKCFRHKVSLEFSPSEAIPGEENVVQVSALPGSLCGLSAVDQSVFIKESGKRLNIDKIFNLLPVKKAFHIPYEVDDAESCLHVRARRYVMPYPQHEEKDAYTVFKKLGLKMLTNLVIKVPSCLMFRGRQYFNDRIGISYRYGYPVEMARLGVSGAPGAAGGGAGSGFGGGFDRAPPPIETVRTFFPETWIWDLVEVGESGTKDVPVTVPDTMTTWETEAFCVSPQGFGLAPPKSLKVFQPFFLELSLPYSIIRGEHFKLKATVFNYLTSCIMVTVSPAASSDYTLTPLSGDRYSSCLCANGRKTLQWTMAPSVLGVMNVTMTAEAVTSHTSCDNEIVKVPERGRIDVVTRSLIVKAEGIEQTKTYNWLLCPKGEALTDNMELQLPENVIDGSERASVTVLGDILGRALNNLDGLLKMPYGCGEQNMALLAPNIYILEYLTNTQQLTQDIKEKATHFLNSGYQRQLNYKDSEGAYSTFGTGVGNTWLTAFVLRSFVKAKSFIYIDPAVITASKSWLESKQKRNGCFQQSGSLFNNRMKGGVSDEVTLSAYVTASLLEMNTSVSDSVVNSSLSCLKNSISDLNNTYTTALLAYVFTLAGDMETRAHLLQYMDKVALQEGSFLHWSQKSSETSASLSVEISAYVLLATLSASPTNADLGYASHIVRWLTSQQNSYGGFSSTQDTVAALQALALYSTLVFSPEGSSIVTVQTPSSQLMFPVTQCNKLLYQEKTLKDLAGKYSLEVKGTACASVQLAVHYNIPTPTDQTAFSIIVRPEAQCNTNSMRPKLTLNLQSLYSGSEPSTNMLIVDVKILSGFVPDKESLRKLRHALLVDLVEQNDDHVIIYLTKILSNIPVNHSLDLVQELQVENLKAAVVKIYDYYQTSDQAETEYTYPCAAEAVK